MYPNRQEVDQFFNKLGDRWSLIITELEEAIEYEIAKGSRKVLYRWASRLPEEMWFAFGNNNLWKFEDWTEMFEPEKQSVHFDYLETLCERYLESPTRVHRIWLLFGPIELQFKHCGRWHNIRSLV